MILTIDILKACMPHATKAGIYVECLNSAMLEFDIETPIRQAMFLAQVAHESGSLQYTLELADGRNYDISVNPELAMKLGNMVNGDGPRFKGRGLLQLTGRTNYLACGRALGRDLLTDSQYLETPMGASRSAAWFWYHKGLNEVADKGLFWTCSKIINGGTNGLDDRIANYIRCRKALGL
jgi:putative chitinase